MRKRVCKLALAVTLLSPIGLVLGCQLWAYVHYRAAQGALARAAFADAQPHLAQCLKVWFWSAETHLLAARTARRAGAYDEAESYLSHCRQLGAPPEAIELEYKLLFAQRGDLPRVESYLVSCVTGDHPDTALILEVLTPEYFKVYELINAQQCARRWVQCEPQRAAAWYWRARVADLLLANQEALESYRTVVELDPDNDEARLMLAGLLTEGHDLQGALAHFEYLRERQGDTPLVLGGLARCRRTLNQPQEARRLLDNLLAEHPRMGLALTERGRLALQTESPAAAAKWFRRALEVTPFEKDANYGLYQCLMLLGKRQEAEAVQAKLKQIEHDLAEMHRLTRAIAHEPHDADLRCQAGLILLRNGQEADGLRWLVSALREDAHHAAAQQALADYYKRTGKPETAGQEAKDKSSASLGKTGP